MSLKESHKLIELIRVSHLSSEQQPSEEPSKLRDYLVRLGAIYAGFKSLKANPKYLKRIFGDELIELLHNRVIDNNSVMQESIHHIFSG